MSKQFMRLSDEDNLTGVVFDIQRYSLGDGRGIRTTVFMKGCNLRCRWCQNPESFSMNPEIAFRRDKCIQCGACVEACSRNAINTNGTFETKPDLCISCGDCTKVCPTKARYMIGQNYKVAELLSVVERDAIFFNESGGGVTLSGGEATLQYEFVHAFLKACRGAVLNTAIETNGFTTPERMSSLVPLLDRIFFDLKIISSADHQSFTGFKNEHILENARWLVKSGAPLTFRIPLIPGLTSNQDNIYGIGRFLNELGVTQVELCPYQNNWERKLSWLNTEQKPLKFPSLPLEETLNIAARFSAFGIEGIII